MVKKKIKIISSFIILILLHVSIHPCLINDEQNSFKHYGVLNCICSIRKMMFNIDRDEVHLKNFFLGIAIYLKYQYTNPCKLLSDEEAQNLTHAHRIIQKIYGSGYNNGQRYGYMNTLNVKVQSSPDVTPNDLATEVLPLLNELQRAKAFDKNNEDPLKFAAFFQYLRECEIGTNELGQQTLKCPTYNMKGMFKAAKGVRKIIFSDACKYSEEANREKKPGSLQDFANCYFKDVKEALEILNNNNLLAVLLQYQTMCIFSENDQGQSTVYLSNDHVPGAIKVCEAFRHNLHSFIKAQAEAQAAKEAQLEAQEAQLEAQAAQLEAQEAQLEAQEAQFKKSKENFFYIGLIVPVTFFTFFYGTKFLIPFFKSK